MWLRPRTAVSTQRDAPAAWLACMGGAVAGAHLCARAPTMLSRLVLPLPDGPMSASTSPGRQHPLTSKRICAGARCAQHTPGLSQLQVMVIKGSAGAPRQGAHVTPARDLAAQAQQAHAAGAVRTGRRGCGQQGQRDAAAAHLPVLPGLSIGRAVAVRVGAAAVGGARAAPRAQPAQVRQQARAGGGGGHPGGHVLVLQAHAARLGHLLQDLRRRRRRHGQLLLPRSDAGRQGALRQACSAPREPHARGPAGATEPAWGKRRLSNCHSATRALRPAPKQTQRLGCV